ncbi:MAG: nicotinate-nicotinamide nucleotide adenylyltransferase, partial [FCB group bacterium]|nr:nicotinate-nicotinamide nucleotide adenylyltransferase [FCB group bacterium]
MGRRIGIFGATFDPPHYGHLTAAEFSRTALKLDEVMMIPASRNPLKLNHIPAPDNIRLKMTAAAIEGNPDFTVNDIEIRRGGLSFMADTLKEIKYKLRDDDRLLLLIGADTAADFKLWKSPFEIIKLTELVVF